MMHTLHGNTASDGDDDPAAEVSLPSQAGGTLAGGTPQQAQPQWRTPPIRALVVRPNDQIEDCALRVERGALG